MPCSRYFPRAVTRVVMRAELLSAGELLRLNQLAPDRAVLAAQE